MLFPEKKGYLCKISKKQAIFFKKQKPSKVVFAAYAFCPAQTFKLVSYIFAALYALRYSLFQAVFRHLGMKNKQNRIVLDRKSRRDFLLQVINFLFLSD
jgi:hypothetical protein